jgi:chromosome segregation ATPase
LEAFERAASFEDGYGIPELVRFASEVLFIGRGSERVIRELDAHGVSISSLICDPENADEAGIYCSQVQVVDPNAATVPVNSPVDAIVLGDLTAFSQPWRLLRAAAPFLREGGLAIAECSSGDPSQSHLALHLERAGFLVQIRQGALVGTPRPPVTEPEESASGHESIAELQAALQSEQSARRALQGALDDMQQAFAAMELRISELSGRRLRLESAPSLEHQQALEALQSSLDAALTGQSQAEARLVQADNAWFELYMELQSALNSSTRLQEELAEAHDSLHRVIRTRDHAQSDGAVLKRRAGELENELRDLREQLEEARNQRDRVHALFLESDSAHAKTQEIYAELQAAFETSQRQYQEIDRELIRTQHHYQEIETQLHAAQRNCQTIEAELQSANAQYHVLDRELASTQNHYRRLEGEYASATAQRDAAANQLHDVELSLAEAKAETAALAGELADRTTRLMILTEELCASAQAETAQLTTLIDVVQSSHFWALKRWLARLRFWKRSH